MQRNIVSNELELIEHKIKLPKKRKNQQKAKKTWDVFVKKCYTSEENERREGAKDGGTRRVCKMKEWKIQVNTLNSYESDIKVFGFLPFRLSCGTSFSYINIARAEPSKSETRSSQRRKIPQCVCNSACVLLLLQ